MYVGRKIARAILAGMLLAGATSVSASETVTYTYDALGRLTNSASSGSVNNGVSTTINYDPAGNRSNYAVVGVPAGQGGSPGPGGAAALLASGSSLGTAKGGTSTMSSTPSAFGSESGPRPFLDDVAAKPPH